MTTSLEGRKTFISACVERIGETSPVSVIASDSFLLREIIALSMDEEKIAVRFDDDSSLFLLDPADDSVDTSFALPFRWDHTMVAYKGRARRSDSFPSILGRRRWCPNASSTEKRCLSAWGEDGCP